MAPLDAGRPPPEKASAAPRQESGATQMDLIDGNSGTSKPSDPRPSTPTRPMPPSYSDDDFNWSTDESVIISEQPETALYWNNRHQLVIRQRCWPDDDSFIYFNKAHLSHLIAMLQAEAES